MPNRSSKGSAGEERIKLGIWGVSYIIKNAHCQEHRIFAMLEQQGVGVLGGKRGGAM